jgi:hypothetical protein
MMRDGPSTFGTSLAPGLRIPSAVQPAPPTAAHRRIGVDFPVVQRAAGGRPRQLARPISVELDRPGGGRAASLTKVARAWQYKTGGMASHGTLETAIIRGRLRSTQRSLNVELP